MPIPTLEVSDPFIDLALYAPEELLVPGYGNKVLDWIADQHVPRSELDSYTVWELTPRQKALFEDELNTPSPALYPAASDHRIDRLGLLQLALSSSLGEPYGVEGQRNGVLLQDVFPKEGLFNRANSGLGATVGFDFHTDQAFSSLSTERPNKVTLACIRNNEAAVTSIISVDDVVEDIDPKVIDTLSDNYFEFYTGRPEEGLGIDYGSVIRMDGQTANVRLGGDTLGCNDASKFALESLREVLRNSKKSVAHVLLPGQIMAFNNLRVLHSRSSFDPHPQVNLRRWIKKVYIK